MTDLHLDVRRIPKKKDLAVTIAGEIVVSARLTEALRKHGITGAEYRPVRYSLLLELKTKRFEVEVAHWA